MVLRRLIVLFLFFITCTSLIAQNYNVKQYSTKDGLTDQIVNAVFQDKSGYIWFATQSGVSYFNGAEVKAFDLIPELIGIDATTIQQDASGAIWIGTNAEGLFKFNDSSVKHFKSIGSVNNPIRKIFLDTQNIIWVLTSKGVYKFVDQKFVLIQDSKNLFKSGVLSMEQTLDGTLWFGTQGNGLVSFKNGNYNYFGEREGIKDSYIFSLFKHGDSLLIGTTNEGVLVKYNTSITKLNVPEIQYSWISNVVSRDNELLIFSSSGLLSYYNDSTYTIINEGNGISSNDIYFGLKDNENNLWLATGNGLNLLRNEEIISFDESYGLTDDKISCLAILKNSNVAIGTNGFGINFFDNKGKYLESVTHPEIMDFKITAIAEDHVRGELWIGGERAEQAFVILDLRKKGFPVKRKIISVKKHNPSTITKILFDKERNVWFSTYDAGLFRISDKDTLNYSKDYLLVSNSITTFLIDRDGLPVVSINKNGLYKLNRLSNKFEHLSNNKKFNQEDVLCLTQDENGTIYSGTSASGLYILNNKNIAHLTNREGLLSNSIQSIFYQSGSLWLGTNKGLNKVILDDNFKIKKIESYNDKTGLINSEIQQENLLVTDEFIWIASSSGLSRMRKDKGDRKQFKPRLELQSVKLFFEDVDWKKKNCEVNQWGVPKSLDLGYKENHLTISFGALTTSQVQYSYILEGQDDNWTPYSEKNEATFSNLTPGNYLFKLKAKNNLGVESDEISFPITIRKPFWQTWWFRILIATIIVLIVIAVIRSREQRYREQNIILESKVTERTKEAVLATEKAEQQRVLVEEKNKEILSSITYAQRIQNAMLPSLEDLQEALSEVEVFYRPKDIVAGDFYWFEETNNHLMIAVADCTGHGVPGALISVVCFNALNRSVREFGLIQPGEVLDKTREIIITELSKHDENVKDGMDISLIIIEKATKKVMWAGANNPLWKINNSTTEIEEIKGDKQPVGMYISEQKYTTHQVEYNPEDTFVLLTDGYADQFGGSHNKKFKPANLKKLLQEYSLSSLKLMEQNLETNFDAWKNSEEQVDDVCVLVFRV